MDLCRRHLRAPGSTPADRHRAPFRLLHPAHGSAAPGLLRAVVVAAVALISFWLSGPTGLWVTAGYMAAYAAYRLANFARCREAHCVVTGTGWSVVAPGAATGAVTGRPTLSEVWLAFALVALVGHGFEAIWRSARGTNALRL